MKEVGVNTWRRRKGAFLTLSHPSPVPKFKWELVYPTSKGPWLSSHGFKKEFLRNGFSRGHNRPGHVWSWISSELKLEPQSSRLISPHLIPTFKCFQSFLYFSIFLLLSPNKWFSSFSKRKQILAGCWFWIQVQHRLNGLEFQTPDRNLNKAAQQFFVPDKNPGVFILFGANTINSWVLPFLWKGGMCQKIRAWAQAESSPVIAWVKQVWPKELL